MPAEQPSKATRQDHAQGVSQDHAQGVSQDHAQGVPQASPAAGIPLLPSNAISTAATGQPSLLASESERYIVPLFKGADFLIPVTGTGMHPTYSSGDIVACRRVPLSNLFFQWNQVYVIGTAQGALIKRVKPGHDQDHILLISDNNRYDPFELPRSAINAVALVIGVIRLE